MNSAYSTSEYRYHHLSDSCKLFLHTNAHLNLSNNTEVTPGKVKVEQIVNISSTKFTPQEKQYNQ